MHMYKHIMSPQELCGRVGELLAMAMRPWARPIAGWHVSESKDVAWAYFKGLNN